jgi:hypothetical protein
MKKVYDAVCVVGEYENKNGEKKKQYLTVGAVFEGEKGMSMKLTAVPVGFNGWISFYVPKEQVKEAVKGAKSDFSDMGDDIPF